MDKKKTHSTFKIRKRPWYAWLMWFLWLVWIIFWAEVSIGSWKETEPRAFAIAMAIFAVSFLGGVLIWSRGYLRSRKKKS